MLKLTKSSKIDFDQYVRDLEKLGFIYASKDDMYDVCSYLQMKANTLRTICCDVMSARSGYVYNSLDKQSVGNYLMNVEHVPENMIYKKSKTTGNYGVSLDSKKVLGPLYDRGFAREFIYYYKEWNSVKNISGSLSKIIDKMVPTDKVDYLGRTLSKITFQEITEAPNRRVYYVNTSLQQIPSIANVAIKAPKGYVLVSGDFKQSDVRIAYSLMLKDESNINLMTTSDDIYEVFARMFLGDEFDKNYFLEHRKEFKVNTLAPIYGATGGLTDFSSKFISKANRYLESAPVYQEYVRRVNKNINLNVKLNPSSGIYSPVYVTSYFGFEQPVQIDYGYGNTDSLKTKLRDKVLNTPIQTGTSEIVIATERAIMNDFAKEGITPENGGIYAYMNRHDELLFLLKEDYLDKAYIFQQNEDVIVDDWIPLKTEFTFSTQYDKEDEELNKYAHSFYRAPEPLPRDYLNSNSVFMPVEDIGEIFIGINSDSEMGTTFVSFFDPSVNKVSFEAYKSVNPDEIISGVVGAVTRNAKTFLKKGCSRLIVYNSLGVESSTVANNLSVVLSSNGNATELSKANLLSIYCDNDYREQSNLPVIENSTLTNSMGYIKSVLRNGELLEE